MKQAVTWVVVANATKARVLQSRGPGKGLEAPPLAELHDDNMSDQEIVSDRPGRAFDSHGQGRHAMARRTDPARHAHREFARAISAWLDDPSRHDHYDRLVIVAAPRLLGDLRDLLSGATRARIVLEIDKDLTASKPSDIVKALSDDIRL